MDRTPRPGELYRHFKGGIYQVIALAVHSETGEQLVVYQAMYGDFSVYARPLSMFISEVDNKKYPQAAQRGRFEKIEKREVSQDGRATSIPEAAYNMQPGNTGSQPVHDAQAGATGSQPVRNARETMAGQMMHNTQETMASQTMHNAQVGTIGSKEHNVMQEAAMAANVANQKPRVQSPAESKRGLHMEDGQIPDTESDYFKRRRRQIEEREHRREQFRKPEKHESATDELRANPSLLKFLDTNTYEEKFRVLTEIQDDMTDRLIDDIAVVLDVVIPEGPINDRYHQLRNIILTRQKYETNRFR